MAKPTNKKKLKNFVVTKKVVRIDSSLVCQPSTSFNTSFMDDLLTNEKLTSL